MRIRRVFQSLTLMAAAALVFACSGGPVVSTSTFAQPTPAINLTAAAATTEAPSPTATTPVAAAANAFLATLSDDRRAQAVFEFSDATAKAQWSNLPRGLFQWAGARMGDLSQE